MLRNVYYILKENDRWTVAAGTSTLGPYEGRPEAIKAAVKVAAGAARDGRRIEIMAQVEDPSTWEKVWMSVEEHEAAE